MKKMLLFVALSIWGLCLLVAGPFGIEMGQSLETLKNNGLNPTNSTTNDDQGYYYVSPKATHPDFEKYIVQLDEDEGVFWIKAVGRDISDSGYGLTIKSKFSEIESSLQKTYGTGKLVDYLYPRSIWDEPGDWMMGIAKNERFYFRTWEMQNGKAFPGNIESLGLGVATSSSSKGYIFLEYSGMNKERLEQKIKDKAAQVF